MDQLRWKTNNLPLSPRTRQCRITLRADGSQKIEMKPGPRGAVWDEAVIYTAPPVPINHPPIAGDVSASQEIN